MERKASTPMRENRRRYEEKHKEARKERNRVWGTSLAREYADENFCSASFVFGKGKLKD